MRTTANCCTNWLHESACDHLVEVDISLKILKVKETEGRDLHGSRDKR